MNGVVNIRYAVVSTLRGFIGIGGGAFFVFCLIASYSLLNYSGLLSTFLNSYSSISTEEITLAFYAPLAAICGAYLAVLIKRAACLYLSNNTRNTVSMKNTIEILLMVSLILIALNNLICCVNYATVQRLHAISIIVSIILAGSGIFITKKRRVPFNTDVVEVKFTEWYPSQQYSCIVANEKYRLIIFCISQSYFIMAAAIMIAILNYH